MKSLKMRVHYLTIGVRDACRLWHIRAIALLVIVSLAGYIAAYYLQENLFWNSVLISCSTGLVTGIVLFVVEQIKRGQNYMLSKDKETLLKELQHIQTAYDTVLSKYISHRWPRTDSVAKLKGCTQNELKQIVSALEKVKMINYEKYLITINYNKKEREAVLRNAKYICENIQRTSELLELSYKNNDAESLYKALCDLQRILDSFEDLYGEIRSILVTYDQLQYLLNSKFV